MFVQKVLNWIVPLEDSKAEINGEDVDISSVSGESNYETDDFDQASGPSFTSCLTSILEPERNPADLGSTLEVVELAAKLDHKKNEGMVLIDNVAPCDSGYSDANRCKLPAPIFVTSDGKQNASIDNVLAEYEDPRAAGGDFARYAANAECLPKSVRHTAAQANVKSVAKISKSRKSVFVQTERTKRQNSKCGNSLKPLPITSGLLKKALVNLGTFFSKDLVLVNDKYSVDPILYRELLVLGCNRSAPPHPSFGSLISILEPERNLADLCCTSEAVELAEKLDHKKNEEVILIGNVPSCNYGYSDVNRCKLPELIFATSDGKQNASIDNVLAEFEDPRAAGGDFSHCAGNAECHPKYQDFKCHNSLKLLPVTSGHLKKAQVNLDAFFSKYSVLVNDKYSGDTTLYGELLVLGSNRSAPPHLQRLMKSRFYLRKRYHPNGVKEAFSFVSNQNQPLSRPLTSHTVSFNISSSRSVVVEYARDKSTDMFQIGRYESSPVDIRVVDVNQARNGVSRFACRIIIQRDDDHQARVYAAAFDATGNIFLGEGAVVCVNEGKMDGFTTNGVLILHPNSQWREVSVCGSIYPLRSLEYEPAKRPRIVEESNVLQDGTLIDLCGVTLLWRSKEGLRSIPNEEFLNKAESLLQELALECHLLPLLPSSCVKEHTYVFLSCGHLMRLRVILDDMEGWSCPVCRCVGPIAELKVGKEPGFYVDRDFPSCAFRPCGHITTPKTAKYWSTIKVPQHRNIQEAFCPFCATKLNSITKYIELAYSE